MEIPKYTVVVEALPAEEGGGYIAFVPDLPGCMSDGDTDFDALQNAHDAIRQWIFQALEMQRPIPCPTRQRQYA